MRHAPATVPDLVRLAERLERLHARQHPGAMRCALPVVEVYRTPEEVVLHAELPGMDPTHLELFVTEDEVTLRGELLCHTEVPQDGFYASERAFGEFARVVPLPAPIQDEQARATFQHGLLTLRAPLKEPPPVRTRRLEVAGPEAALPEASQTGGAEVASRAPNTPETGTAPVQEGAKEPEATHTEG